MYLDKRSSKVCLKNNLCSLCSTQLCAVCATFFNLSVGVLLRIPAETTNYSINNDKDAAGVTFSLLLVNVGVVVMLVSKLVKLPSNTLHPTPVSRCLIYSLLSSPVRNVDDLECTPPRPRQSLFDLSHSILPSAS